MMMIRIFFSITFQHGTKTNEFGDFVSLSPLSHWISFLKPVALLATDRQTERLMHTLEILYF